MSKAVLLGLLLGVFADVALAADAAVAKVEAIYRLYRVKSADPADTPDQLDPKLYSARRKVQIAALNKACEGRDMCLPDFDHLVDGQDHRISELKVKRLPETPSRPDVAKVDVRFKNFRTPTHFVFTLVNEGGVWLIDEVEGGGKESRYTLDEVLKPNLL